eukprot:Nitzschia sp. Nitz4//scaffold131_size63436//12955//13617//NITZ4_006266-RA/size63436-processed-gene-0.96-mRNA-1//1//CDS//3329535241//4325//frame0
MPATTTSQSQLGGIHTSGLAAKSMIDSAPQQHGVVLKLHIPILFTILPEFLQNIILSFSFLSFLAPSWEQRYLILCGSFLYKFQDQVSTTPKGAPFDLETINVELVKNGRFPELGKLPPGYTSVFCVSTLRRKHYYAVVDEEEALLWSRCLKDARQEAITRNMGHAANVPYPQSWTYYDSLGRNLVKSKERIRERLDEYNMREMEMSTFSDGSIPRGFYG